MKHEKTPLLFLLFAAPVVLGIIAVILLFFENRADKVDALSWQNKDGACLVSFDISNTESTPRSVTAIIHIYTQKEKGVGVPKKGTTIINEVGKKQLEKTLNADETHHVEERFATSCDFVKVFLLRY